MEILQAVFGIFQTIPFWMTGAVLILIPALLGFLGARLWAWALFVAGVLYGFGAAWWVWGVYGLIATVVGAPPLRLPLVRLLMGRLKEGGFLPVVSATEKEALDAGTVWIEGMLFDGSPDLRRIAGEPYAALTEEERAFMNGPVQSVCDRVDNWDVLCRRDLSPEVWELLRKERLFGLVIPKEYGGHGFSASGNSAIVLRMASASPVLGITVMVPNSLGPAELLLHYGTPDQKAKWLPRLARGEEIPAFALTETEAGSDAGAMRSKGIVFRGEDGRLMLRLTWKKRYITLASVSTVLGLAFKVYDPENLLGLGPEPGITCGLVPTRAPGISVALRHDPMGVPFWNSPTEGHDVVVSLEESVIGGVAGVGRGWRMLMESLAAGRGISLPATAVGAAKRTYRVAGAHAALRRQFGVRIGSFEGIDERLARIGGLTYVMEAARRFTNGALDRGMKPAVVTAMMKVQSTEMQRTIVNDGMDILAGNAISRGPRNLMSDAYAYVPVCITVEGANILTRTLIVFGQGAIRCHPFALREMTALSEGDVKAFDAAFRGHVRHVVRNLFRSVFLSLSRGRLAVSPVGGPTAKYWRKLAWSSATFALLADLALIGLGGSLKRREKLTGRFADAFSWMFLSAAVMRRWEADERPEEDLAFVRWALETGFLEIQKALDGLFAHLPVSGMAWLLRGPVASWSRLNPFVTGPSDADGTEIARKLMEDGPHRDRHTDGAHVPTGREGAVGRQERAFSLVHATQDLDRRLRDAVRAGTLPRRRYTEVVELAETAGVLTAEEASLLLEAEMARQDAIEVDVFTLSEYMGRAAVTAGPPDPKGNQAAAPSVL